ncbi:outer membrane lipoprotein carrier protein LolA [candidate division KSB1 bacterium]|nr:outer membrane lipoprotein carrier protein LolA [candidate division KSB1 bacterium]
MMKFKHFLPILLATLSVMAMSADKDAEQLLKKVQKAYQQLDQVCADFSQTFFWKLTNERQTTVGTVCAKGGDKFRIETPEQLIVTDGEVLWTLNKMNNQVIIDFAENANSDNPFIKDFMDKYVREYEAQMVADQSDETSHCLLLTSKSGEQFVPQLWLWINKRSDLIDKIVQVDVNENTTEFKMSNLDTKVTLSNSEFSYKAPDDAETIDMR